MASMPDSLSGWRADWIFVGVCSYSFSAVFLIRSSHCVGSTAEGRDFESFVGAEKAQEIRTLFSSWIHAVYRESFLARKLLVSVLTGVLFQPSLIGLSSPLTRRPLPAQPTVLRPLNLSHLTSKTSKASKTSPPLHPTSLPFHPTCPRCAPTWLCPTRLLSRRISQIPHPINSVLQLLHQALRTARPIPRLLTLILRHPLRWKLMPTPPLLFQPPRVLPLLSTPSPRGSR